MDIFLIFSVLAVVAVFGYFFYNRHKRNKELAEILLRGAKPFRSAKQQSTPPDQPKKEADSIDRP